MVLGLWHTYKHASLLLWRRFMPFLIAGVFHFLFPNSACFTKPRLVAATELYIMLRLAYPAVKEELEEALATAAEPASRIKRQSKLVLENLRDLCEYYIPTVGSSVVVCSFLHVRKVPAQSYVSSYFIL